MKDINELILFFAALLAVLLGLPEYINNLSNLSDFNFFGLIVPKKVLHIILNLILIALTLFLFIRLFIGYIRTKRATRILIEGDASKTIRITAILLERCKEIIQSNELQKLLNIHIKNIEDKINSITKNLDSTVERVINNDFFDQAIEALRSKKAKQQFQPILEDAYSKIIGQRDLEVYLQREFQNCLKAIEEYILKWLKDEDISNYLEITKNVQSKLLSLKEKRGGQLYFFLHPKLNDILTLNYEKVILVSVSTIPIFKFLTQNSKEQIANSSVNALGAFMGEFGMDDDFGFGDVDVDVDISGIDPSDIDGGFFEEIGNHVFSEFIEIAGATLPYIGFAFLIIKAIRYFGWIKMLIDKPSKIIKMRKNIIQQLNKFLNSTLIRTTHQLDRSSHELISILNKEFTKIQNTARSLSK